MRAIAVHIVIFIGALIHGPGAQAFEGIDLQFRHLTTSHGLSNPKVFSITQDYLGYIWIGTENGLNRFDGHSMVNYYYDPDQENSIVGNSVMLVHEDMRRNLWAFTENGACIYSGAGKDFKPVHFLLDDSVSLDNAIVRGIAEDSDSTLWVITDFLEDGGNTLYTYDTKEGYFVPFLNMPLEELREFGLRSFFIDSQDRIWVGSFGNGLFRVNTTTRKLEPVVPDEKTEIISITEDREGTIWFSSYSGLYAYHPVSGVKRIFRHDPNDPSSISSNSIMSVFVDSFGNLWVGTDDTGLCLYNHSDQSFQRFTHSEFIDNTLVSNRVLRTIFEDRQNNLWVGTGFGGVSYAEIDRMKKFEHLKRNPSLQNTLTYSAVSAIIEDSNGDLWIGTDGGGLNYYNTSRDEFTHFIHDPNDPESICHDVILALLEDSRGNIWVGTYYGGISVYNPTKGTFENLYFNPDDDTPRQMNDVRSIIEDMDGNIWAATNGGGVLRINPYSMQVEEHLTYDSNKSNTISSDWNMFIYEDSRGIIWVTSYWGITRIDRATGLVTPLYGDPDDPTTLSHNWVYAAIEGAEGNMWFGTGAGLTMYKGGGQFVSYNPTDASVGAMRAMELDDVGNIWIATHQGILKFNPTDSSFRVFNQRNGLPPVSYTSASHKAKSGRLYFGSNDGLTMFFPHEIRINKQPLSTIITTLYINYNEVIPNTDDAPLSDLISRTERINLGYNQNTIGFNYIAFDYANVSHNRYAYILEGFDTDWHFVGGKREVTYTNIPPGTYTFRVKAANSDGVWNPHSTNLEIIIAPPFWRTWWFRALVTLLFFATIYMVHNYRMYTIRQRAKELEQAVDERTAELVDKNEELEVQSNELNEVNTLLEERHQMIEEQTERLAAQKEELEAQKNSLEEANSQLQNLNATKDKFFSIIAHDLKSPFNILIGFSEILIENQHKYDKETIIERVKLINESSEKIYNLLLNLLEWSRSQRGLIEANPTVFDFQELVKSNLELLADAIKEKGITVDSEGINPPYELFADRDLLNTVVRNLISNAIKFTPNNGKVSISSGYSNEAFIFAVKDTGIGIDKDLIDKLFNVEEQVSREGTNSEQGTGLGLIICKEFIDLHKGNIKVESTKGEGSTFTVSIPQKIKF